MTHLSRAATAAALFLCCLSFLSPRVLGQTGGSTELLTVTPAGVAGGGESFGDDVIYGTGQANISLDNRFVVFSSASPQLVPGDLNGVQDVFVRDRLTGTTTLVSRASNGTQGNAPAGQPVISADGRYVAFISAATNLVPGDNNQQIDPGLGTPNPFSGYDVFVHDRNTGTTVRASLSSTGTEGEFGVATQAPAISDDGRYVVFTSASASLAAGDSDLYNTDVYMRDMVAGTTQRISIRPGGGEIVGADASQASISADGSRVAFTVYDNTLAGPTPQVPPNLTRGIYYWDRATGQTTLVSARPDGTPATFVVVDFPTISANGRYVSFASWEDLDPSAPDSAEEELLDGPFSDIFVRDLQTATTRRASMPFPGGPAEESGRISSISGDGRFVIYGNRAEFQDLVVRDMLTNSSRVLRAPDGSTPNHYNPTVSRDARWVYIESFSDLLPSDTNGIIDAYLLPVPPPTGADLSLTLSAAPLQPAQGTDVTLTVGVSNGGGEDASGITVTVPLPAGLTYVSDTGAGAFAGDTWTIDNLAAGSSASLQIVARVDTLAPVSITTQVMTATPSDPDSTPGNNIAAEDDQKTVTITPQAIDLALSLNANTLAPLRNSNVTLSLGVGNSGVIAATGVSARLLLPPDLTYVSDSGGGSYDAVTGRWTIGTLAPGATAAHQVVARVASASPIDVTAEIVAANEIDRDSTPANNNPAEDDQASVPLVPLDAGIVVNDATGVVSAIDGKCTLVEAIIAANTDLPSGNAIGECAGGNGADTIHLQALTPPYTYVARHDVVNGFNGLPTVTSHITIDAGGQTIRRSAAVGTPAFRLFYVAPGATLTLDHAVVSNGLATDPTGVNTAAFFGGAIFNAGTLQVVGGRIAGNSAGCDGGGIMTTGPLIVSDGAVVESNAAGCSGGGIGGFYAGTIAVTDTTIRNNTAVSGAGFYVHGTTTATLSNVLIQGNTASSDGGGIFTHNADANVSITGSQILSNVASFGQGGGISNGRLVNAGGVSIPGGTMSIAATTVAGNRAAGLGGGIASGGPLTISASRVESNLIAGATAFCGGGIYSAADLLSTGTTFTLNQSFNGGGVCSTGNASLVGGSITSNSASNVGGGVGVGFLVLAGLPARQVTLTGVTVASNTAVAVGGGIYFGAAAADDALTLDSVTVQQNSASAGKAGGLYGRGGRVTLQNNTRILSNTAAEAGGGILTESTSGGCCDGPFVMTGGTIDGNRANGSFAANGGGGGIAHFARAAASAMTLTGVTINGNRAPGGGNGGGIFNTGTLNVTSSTLSGNDAQSGGAVSNGTSNLAGGPAIFIGTVIASNIATSLGGGIFAANPVGGPATGTTTISGGRISANRASDGGGVFLRPNTTVTLDTTIVDTNIATSQGGGINNTGTLGGIGTLFTGNVADAGGGLYVSGSTTLRASTLSGNNARLGGGLRATGGIADLTNSTISGNSATASAGAIDVVGAAGATHASRVNLIASTVVNNVGFPGGIDNGSYLQIALSILAGNRRPTGVPSECGATVVPGSPPATFQFGSNIIGQDPGCLISNNNGEQRLVDSATVLTSLVEPLADNGGPTPTHALRDGSLAIDSVIDPAPFSCTVDQRGQVRPFDGDGDGVASCDAGAVERHVISPLPTPILTGLSPATAIGAPPVFVVVNGTGFTAGSVALWNGTPRKTIVQSPTSLRVDLLPGDGGTGQDITTAVVTIRSASGALSNPVAFTVLSARVSSAQSRAAAPGTSVSASTSSGASGGVSATLTNNNPGSAPATLTVATYNVNPAGGTFFAAGGYFDLQVTGADATDSVNASFYYPSSVTGLTEAALQLRYWTGTSWAAVVGSGGAVPDKSTIDNLDGVTSGGRFRVTLDATSTPPITALGGTVFALGSVETRTRIVGSGYNSPEIAAYRATFSVDASGPASPAGSLKYSYARTRMNFASAALTSFVVSGNTATIEGTGTVNGVSGYTFVATVSAETPNTFAITIRGGDGSVHYSAPALVVTGGSFTVTP